MLVKSIFYFGFMIPFFIHSTSFANVETASEICDWLSKNEVEEGEWSLGRMGTDLSATLKKSCLNPYKDPADPSLSLYAEVELRGRPEAPLKDYRVSFATNTDDKPVFVITSEKSIFEDQSYYEEDGALVEQGIRYEMKVRQVIQDFELKLGSKGLTIQSTQVANTIVGQTQATIYLENKVPIKQPAKSFEFDVPTAKVSLHFLQDQVTLIGIPEGHKITGQIDKDPVSLTFEGRTF